MLKVIRFTASWCGPCQQLKPIMEEVQKDNPDVVFEVVDVENDNRGLAAENGIMGVPAIVMLVDGLPMTRFAGVRPKEYIQEEIDRLK